MKKISSILFVVIALALVVSPAEAGNRYRRGGNSTEIKNVCKTEVNQTNVSNIVNGVSVVTNTGGNSANGNTKGNVTVTTGDATSTVRIMNMTGGNFATVSGCCCEGCGSTCSNQESPCQL